MTPAEELNALLKELRDGPVPLASTAEVDTQRQRLLPRLRQQVRQVPELAEQRQRRLRRRTKWVSSFAVAAAAVGIYIALPKYIALPEAADPLSVNAKGVATLQLEPRSGEVELMSAAGELKVFNAKDTISASGRLKVTESAQLTTSQGVAIELGAGTQVGLDGLTDKVGRSQLNLVSGSVHCTVPPLGSSQFSVAAGGTQVVVHGTVFSVAMTSAGLACVRVSQGKVEVRDQGQSQFLSAGEDWGCESPERSQASSTTTPESAKPETKPAPKPQIAHFKAETPQQQPAETKTEQSPLEKAQRPGTLAEETELIAEALSAERRGRTQRARDLYRRLLDKYPDSPLAPDAKHGLQRLRK